MSRELKEDVKIQFRVSGELRKEFMDACKENGHKAADIFRDAMLNYLKYSKTKKIFKI